ncbi:hypothetical protein ACH4VS_32915 [Streptomyces hygroscopicus]|uniref:hypothetical protein n=1 Tax=Streptomyces hygroscopicus TaxID=1912 RepID=UPI0008332AC0|nr:hypothetical protein [Streptomyces hygroscopicus]GLV77947.1 hypothetical protein Shyhy02_59470 [Streptomyces hygroscopicus subsp. hygroscopicus]
MPSAADVRDILAPHLVGRLEDGLVLLDVVGLDVIDHGRRFTVAMELFAPDGHWRVHLECDSTEHRIFDSNPEEELVQAVAISLRIRLFEWWHTKDSERKSARMGERLT